MDLAPESLGSVFPPKQLHVLSSSLDGFLHRLLGKLLLMLQNPGVNVPSSWIFLLLLPLVQPSFPHVAGGVPVCLLCLPLTEAFSSFFLLLSVAQAGTHHSSPRKVWEMYSDTWFPERLVSDR